MAIQTIYEEQGGVTMQPFDKNLGISFAERFKISAANIPVASGDVLKLMNVPLETLIEQIIVDVKTVEDGTLTIDVGDYTISDDVAVDADGYFDGLDLEVLGDTSTNDAALVEDAPNTIRAYEHGGKYYPDGLRYLGILFNNAADAAVFEVIVVGKKLAYA